MTDYPLPSAMFYQRADHTFRKMMGLLLLAIVTAEFVLMLSFSWFHLGNKLTVPELACVNAVALFLITCPMMYFWMIKPVKKMLDASQFRHHILSSAVKAAGDGIIITNRKGVIEYVNQAFREMTQLNNEDVIGKHIASIDPGVAEMGWKKRFAHAIRHQGLWHDEQWRIRQQGEKYLARVKVTPLHMEAHKKATHFVTILQDATAYHQLKLQLSQAQKMESLGTLVGGISHDFNNMLAALNGQVYLIKIQLKGNKKAIKRLNKIQVLSDHAADMIRQLLLFARKGNIEKTALPLSSFMKEALKLAAVSLSANIDFQVSISNARMMVYANATQLQQGMMNLINNARDALEGVEQPRMHVSLNIVAADDPKLALLNPAEKEYAVICVSDNGCGIKEKDLSKIMEPFFTTKGVGKGTGLGLSMLYGIIQAHQGLIDIKSKPGHGTSIYLYLPLSNVSCGVRV